LECCGGAPGMFHGVLAAKDNIHPLGLYHARCATRRRFGQGGSIFKLHQAGHCQAGGRHGFQLCFWSAYSAPGGFAASLTVARLLDYNSVTDPMSRAGPSRGVQARS